MLTLNSEKGSTSIIIIVFTMLLTGTFLGNVFLKKILMEKSSHNNLCRKETLKFNHFRGKISEKLISLNSQIIRLRKREKLLLVRLSLNPSPAHKLKLIAQLKNVRTRMTKIHFNQKQIVLSFHSRSTLRIRRLERKISKLCKANNSTCSRISFSEKPHLPVQKTNTSIPPLYTWDRTNFDLPTLTWKIRSASFSFKELLFLENQTNLEIRCQSTINTQANRYAFSSLTQAREF